MNILKPAILKIQQKTFLILLSSEQAKKVLEAPYIVNAQIP